MILLSQQTSRQPFLRSTRWHGNNSISNIVTIILGKRLQDLKENCDAAALPAQFIHERPLPKSRRDQSSDGPS
jgi:hypothetical protein